ncbi:uncharacterized protein LOC135396745 [Ornithodoros turicata]|uniref:uncharacterized protein LOC135396745 n=1 Tax=Ornithodoros turicata TaxID=34597 RepID=UPI003139A60F
MVGDAPTALNHNIPFMDSSNSKKHGRYRKRHRTDVLVTQSLDLTPEPWFAKVLIIHGEDESNPLSKVSPFAIAKELEKAIGKSYSAKKLTTGDLQIEVQTRQQSSTLLSLNRIPDVPVKVSRHRTLNIVKGVISEHELLDCSDAEIEEGLKDEGVVTARRITMRRDGKEIATKHIVISFQLHKLPTTIKAGYINCHVRPYIPNPRRCFKCQRFGQGSQVCRGQATCPKCAGTDHAAETCEKHVRCANCKGNHPVYSRSCPRWKEEKDILKVKVTQNLSYRDAKAQVEFSKKGTFSEVVRRGVAPLRKPVETQTSGSLPNTPQQKGKDTEVSLPVSRSPPETETTSTEVHGTASIWDGATPGQSHATLQDMDMDDDDCLSQKSSSSIPGVLPQGKEKRERTSSRGRGSRPKSTQKVLPPRITPP